MPGKKKPPKRALHHAKMSVSGVVFKSFELLPLACLRSPRVPASRRGFFPAICSVIFAPAFAALRRIGRFKGRDRRSVALRAGACSSIRLSRPRQESPSRRWARRRVGRSSRGCKRRVSSFGGRLFVDRFFRACSGRLACVAREELSLYRSVHRSFHCAVQ